MKVSETAPPKNEDPKQHGTVSNLGGKQQKSGGGGKGRNGSCSNRTTQSGSTGKSSDSKGRNDEKRNPPSSTLLDQKDVPGRKETKNGSSTSPQTKAKKPWIPCTRRPSKPKPLPDILDMALSAMDSAKVCKKYLKSPLQHSPSTNINNTEKIKGNQMSETANANNKGPVSERLTTSTASANGNTNGTAGSNVIPASSSVERRARVVLKRQFALDRAPTGNLKEAISDESLNSINSVTQLLKIERSAYTSSNNKAVDKDDKEEVLLTGVKLIAARLEAKNVNNSVTMPIRNGVKNNRSLNENGSLKSKVGDDDDGNTFNSTARPGHLQTKHHYHNQKNKDSLQKNVEIDKASMIVASPTSQMNAVSSTSTKREPQEMDGGSQQILAKSHTTAAAVGPSEATMSSSILLTAAAAAVPSHHQTGRKKVNPVDKTSQSTTSTASSKPSLATSAADFPAQVNRSRSSSPVKPKEQGKLPQTIISTNNQVKSKADIRSRSNSPVKPSSVSERPATKGRIGSSSSTATTKSEAKTISCSNHKTSKTVTLTKSNGGSWSRSSSPRKSSLGSASSSSPQKADRSAAPPPLSKHSSNSNQIKDKSKGLKKDTNTSAVEQKPSSRKKPNETDNQSKSNLIRKSSLDNKNPRGQTQSKDVNGSRINSESHTGSRRNSRKSNDDRDGSVKRYALPTIASQASQNSSPVRNNNAAAANRSVAPETRSPSLSRERSRSRTRTRDKKSVEEIGRKKEVEPIPNNSNGSNKSVNRGKLILTETKKLLTKEPCKLEANTNNSGRNHHKSIVIGTSRKSSSEDVLDYSLSSLSTPSASNSASASSSVSVTSSPSTSWRSRKKQLEQQRIIPSIIMSEYVEGKDNGRGATVVAHSQSLFTPLQFVEPLKQTCDIKEGSSLELNVRIRGAEAVVWLKENKIIPNSPPDFQYISEKANDSYGLRIADVFLQDAGLYTCQATGVGGSEKIICWCDVDVIEASGKHDDDADDDDGDDEEDISWEDLDILEEVKSPQPLVVPVIVTSQAEQEREPTPTFETAQSKEPSPVRTVVTVKQVVRKEEESETNLESSGDYASYRGDFDQLITTKRLSRKSPSNESAFSNSSVMNGTMKKSQSPSEAPSINQNDEQEECSLTIEEMVTEPAFENAAMINKTQKEFSNPEESVQEPVTASPPVAIVIPPEEEAKGNQQSHINDEKEATDITSQSSQSQLNDSNGTEKRKLMSQLSSASDESIYLKEPRSGDEGALSSNEETSGPTSISFLDGKSNAGHDEEINTVTSESPPVSSPFSEQNAHERSSSVDSAIGFLGRPLFSDGKFPPRILVGPSNIIALYGEVVHLRVKVQNYGIPKTSVNWFKFINGTYKKIESSSVANAVGDQSTTSEEAHVSMGKCGASLNTLTISHINYDDCGRYRVKVQNLLGMDSHDCLLTVEGPPEAPTTPPKVKYDEKSKTILIQWSSCPYDGGSKITGYYVEASIVQSSKTAINKEDQDNWQLLTPQSYSWLCYTLTEPKRGSVYRFRVFGENIYGKGDPTEASLPLLVPVLMEGRRAGSSDALLWSLKSLSLEETSLRADSKRNNAVMECENEMATGTEESASSQEEEEPVDYKNVSVRRESFHTVYDKLDELGKGRFGVVFEVVHKETKKSYAGKFVKCIKGKDKERVQLEVQIMNDLEYHPKLICLIDAFEMPREIVIVTQQINGGELFERVVADDFTLTEGDCITFLRQICDAVGYIHTKNIMHLDLKPENILCTSKNSNSIKIIDFGLAQYHDPNEPIRVLFGTAEFVSPEIINYEPIAPSTDFWSVGVITYILLSGLSPFMGDNDNETFSNITRAEFDFDDEAFEQISDDAKEFISSLIVKRPEKRLTAEECLNHRWLKESDEKKKVVLPTDKLKRFLVRRKWQKTGNAIRALGRITTLYSSRRSSSTTSTPSMSMSISSPPPPQPVSPSRSGSLVTQDSADYDNVFFTNKQHPSPTTPTNHSGSQDNSSSISYNNNASLAFNNNVNQHISSKSPVKISPLINSTNATSPDASTNRTKYTDNCRRSDSGVCDVGSFSSSLSYDGI